MTTIQPGNNAETTPSVERGRYRDPRDMQPVEWSHLQRECANWGLWVAFGWAALSGVKGQPLAPAVLQGMLGGAVLAVTRLGREKAFKEFDGRVIDTKPKDDWAFSNDDTAAMNAQTNTNIALGGLCLATSVGLSLSGNATCAFAVPIFLPTAVDAFQRVREHYAVLNAPHMMVDDPRTKASAVSAGAEPRLSCGGTENCGLSPHRNFRIPCYI